MSIQIYQLGFCARVSQQANQCLVILSGQPTRPDSAGHLLGDRGIFEWACACWYLLARDDIVDRILATYGCRQSVEQLQALMQRCVLLLQSRVITPRVITPLWQAAEG